MLARWLLTAAALATITLGAALAQTNQPLTEADRKSALAEVARQLREQVRRCWQVEAGAVGSKTVTVEFELRPNGALFGNPRIAARAGTPTPVALAKSATDAVRACAPYTGLPRSLYSGGWDRVRLTFDTKGLQ
jgi:predicted RNA-binding Zn ribbon-like protein